MYVYMQLLSTKGSQNDPTRASIGEGAIVNERKRRKYGN